MTSVITASYPQWPCFEHEHGIRGRHEAPPAPQLLADLCDAIEGGGGEEGGQTGPDAATHEGETFIESDSDSGTHSLWTSLKILNDAIPFGSKPHYWLLFCHHLLLFTKSNYDIKVNQWK